MKAEKHDLIESLLDEGQAARRTATLRAGGQILRRRRWQRRGLRVLACLMVAASVAVLLHKPAQPKPLAVTVPLPAKVQTGSLTDAQLFAMFPNTPVGLITLKNGQKRLIFPRPADAQKYVAKF